MRPDLENYRRTFPNWPPVVEDKGWVYGVWMIGNNYRGSGYYGAYPPTYLKRVKALFPDAACVLHLFSGKVEKGLWETEYTLDINPELNPDIVGDAETVELPEGVFDLVLADPPYSEEDAAHYGRCLVDRRKVLINIHPAVVPGGMLLWLDQVLPMYRKDMWKLVGTIGLVRSTNHRVRMVFFFRKEG